MSIERIKKLIRSTKLSNDDTIIDKIATLVNDELAQVRTPSSLFDIIGDTLISCDVAGDESSSRAACTRLFTAMKDKGIVTVTSEKKDSDDDDKDANDDNDDSDPDDDDAVQRVLQDMAAIELTVGMAIQACWHRDRQWYNATISAIDKIKAVATPVDTAATAAAPAAAAPSSTTARVGRSPVLAASTASASVPPLAADNDDTNTASSSSSSSSTSSGRATERPKSAAGGRSPSRRGGASGASSTGGRMTAAAKKREAAAKKRERTASKKIEWINVYRIVFDGHPNDIIQIARHHIRLPSPGSSNILASLGSDTDAKDAKSSSSSSSSVASKKVEVPLSPRSRARIIEEQQHSRDIARGRSDPDCAMCDRTMPLTAHHLTPRTTHAKYLAQGLTQSFLNTCIDVCRPCHSALHKLIDEPTLAADFNTLEKLMADERIQRWVNYARKQRARPKEHGHDAKTFKYRR